VYSANDDVYRSIGESGFLTEVEFVLPAGLAAAAPRLLR
jgi:hypothetical protein